METDKKIEIILLAVLVALASAFLLSRSTDERVDILYFRNDRCALVRNTDKLIGEVKSSFGKNVDITSMNASLYPDDPKESDEVKQLREQYNVIGLPEIVINGQEMKSEYTKTNLFSEICNKFMVKPLVCL